MSFKEWRFKALDGLELYGCEWEVEQPEGIICLIHGMGEHSGRYNSLANSLNAQGYGVLSMDLRGHGQSQGKRGHVSNYEVLLDDIDGFVREAVEKHPQKPVFLYGHSLGGNLVINYTLGRQPSLKVKGVIATSPWLRLAFAPSIIKVAMAEAVGRIWPSFSQANGLVAEHLSHDKQVVAAYQQDPLVHQQISAALFTGAYQAGLDAVSSAASFPLPLLLLHGKGDKITSWEASREFAQGAGEKCTFLAWEELYHELHHEPQWPEIYEHLVDWLVKQRISV